MDSRALKPEYEAIARRLIETRESLQAIRNSNVRIAFLSSEHSLKKAGKTVFGQCEKIQEKYKWAIPYDFTITVFEPNVERFTDEQIERLLHHELLHVGIEKDGNEEKYRNIPHDIEDFEEILACYGLDWSKT